LTGVGRKGRRGGFPARITPGMEEGKRGGCYYHSPCLIKRKKGGGGAVTFWRARREEIILSRGPEPLLLFLLRLPKKKGGKKKKEPPLPYDLGEKRQAVKNEGNWHRMSIPARVMKKKRKKEGEKSRQPASTFEKRKIGRKSPFRIFRVSNGREKKKKKNCLLPCSLAWEVR